MRRDALSGSLPAWVRALHMCWLWHKEIQDWTLLLNWLVALAEVQLVDSQSWLERDRGDQAFQDSFLVLEERHIALLERMVGAQDWQAAMGAGQWRPVRSLVP